MKIFQEKSGKLKNLETKISQGKNFDNEKTIQTLIENNLNEIFTDLEFVKTEHQIDDLRIDTIAFDKNRNSFVIIEYKNKKDEDILAQGISYYQLLQENRGEFVLLYNKIKNVSFEINHINWYDARIIFIAPTFTKYQKKASGFAGLPTEFYEIKKYENEVITLNRIDVKTDTSVATGKKKVKGKSHIAYAEYTEEDYLAGKYGTTAPNAQTKELWSSLKDTIQLSFDDMIEYQQKKKYGGFYTRDDNACICTLDATKSAIWLSYSITKKNFFESPFVSYTTKGHFGVGHYRSKITNAEDIEKALPHIQKVLGDKIKSYGAVIEEPLDALALEESPL